MGTPNLANVPHLVRSPREVAQYHKENVADILHRNNLNFPGAQPVSFARRHLKELEQQDYFLAEKTDGIRLLLFLTQIQGQSGNMEEAHFLIDRKNDYYYIEPGWLHVPPQHPSMLTNPPNPKFRPRYVLEGWHNGTILDGELVLEQYKDGRQKLVFLIFDCLAMQGQDITDRDYGQRIGKMENGVIIPYNDFCKDWPNEAKVHPFTLEIKRPTVAYGMSAMFKDTIPNLTHGNDGLIFTCKDTKYISGTDQHILKWKPPHENTIDFKLQIFTFPIEQDDEGTYEDFDQKPQIELLVNYGNNEYRKFADLHLTNPEWEAIKSMNQMIDHRIIECYREKDTGHWRPKIEKDGTPRFRDDKKDANHISTVESVLESIEDAVSEEDLIGAYDRIRSAWKMRAARVEEEKEKRKKQLQAAQQSQQAQGQARAPPQQAQPPAQVDGDGGQEDDGPRYED